jgi:hypothetical protein
MNTQGAPYLVDASLRGRSVPATSAAKLRALLARVQACDGRDESLSHDIWWELVDVPTGATREIGGLREINYTAGDPALKPFWRAPGISHFGDQPNGPLLIESLDRVADLAGRVLTGWRWQLHDGGGPDNDQCFACVYSKFGAFSALQNALPAAFIAAILEARVALAGVDDEKRFFWRRPLAILPQGRQYDAFEAGAAVSARMRLAGGNHAHGQSRQA